MTDLTTNLDFRVSATRIGAVSRASQIFRAIARTLADFNRYIDAAQKVHGANQPH